MGVLMKCGCVSHAVCNSMNGVEFNPPIPSCVTHSCIEVAEVNPSLDGRVAKCIYKYGCKNTQTSSYELPFFVYKGPDSLAAKTTCAKCKRSIEAHLPQYEATIHIERRWFKKERIEEDLTRRFPAYDENSAKIQAEREADFFRKQTGKHHKDTEVYSAIVTKLVKGKPIEAHEFVEHGPFEADEYYCGCMGWD